MTNNPPEPTITNPPTPPANDIPVQMSPPKKTIPLIIVFTIAILFIAGFSYYFGTNNYKLSLEKKSDGQKAGEISPSPVPNASPTQSINNNPTASPSSAPVTRKVTGNLPVIPGSTVFTSETLGIRFRHADMITETNPQAAVYTSEVGNKVYVYLLNTKPEDGQYVEVLKKDKQDTLEQAITKQFLKGIASTDCYVKTETDKNLPANFTKAVIAYPIPTDSDQPYFTYGEKCPDHYTAKGGIAYFLYDNKFPEKLLFFSIGQYGIDAEKSKPDSSWQDTIEIVN